MTLLLMQQAGTNNRSSCEEALVAVDACVSCGLCLPHCPTYRLADNEAESPRGRIALVRGLLTGQLTADDSMLAHLDSCLLCRSCERVCPAQVRYEQIIDGARSELKARGYRLHRKGNRLADFISNVIRSRKTMRPLAAGLSVIQRSGLAWLADKSGIPGLGRLGRTVNALPTFSITPILRKYYPAQNNERGTVALFTGCISEQGDKQTLLSGISVLNKLGYNVMLPKGQCCCGANDLHEGNREAAERLAWNNIKAFSDQNIQAVVSMSTGCGAALRQYHSIFKESSDRNNASAQFSGKVFDISEFIMSTEWPENVSVSPSTSSILLHEPCSTPYAVGETSQIKDLVKKVPGIELVAPAKTTTCCGASGMKFVLDAEMADRVGDDYAKSIRQAKPAFVLSANFTCRTHLQKLVGMDETGFMHPVSFLDQHLSVRTGEVWP